MRQEGSTSTESGLAAGSDALIALVRLLARETAREFAAQAPAPSSSTRPQPGDRR
jgi:hypothetical protein